MRVPPALVVAAAVLLAGCLGQPAEDPSAEHGFEGVFLVTVQPAEIVELTDRIRAEGGELDVTDKVPPAFEARGLTRAACEVVLDYLATKLYVARVSACIPVETPLPPVVAASFVVPEAADAP